VLNSKETKSDIKIDLFHLMLSSHGLEMRRDQTRTLQINVGFKCNQKCQHCHLDAGPDRKENMTRETMLEVVDYARRSHFDMVDITGGAPELNPHVETLIKQMAALVPRIMFRSNLSALNSGARDTLMQVLKTHKVVVVASFTSVNVSQTESQYRGSTKIKPAWIRQDRFRSGTEPGVEPIRCIYAGCAGPDRKTIQTDPGTKLGDLF